MSRTDFQAFDFPLQTPLLLTIDSGTIRDVGPILPDIRPHRIRGFLARLNHGAWTMTSRYQTKRPWYPCLFSRFHSQTRRLAVELEEQILRQVRPTNTLRLSL